MKYSVELLTKRRVIAEEINQYCIANQYRLSADLYMDLMSIDVFPDNGEWRERKEVFNKVVSDITSIIKKCGLVESDPAKDPVGGSWSNGVKNTFSHKMYNGKSINFIFNDFEAEYYSSNIMEIKVEQLKNLVAKTEVSYGKNVVSFLSNSFPYKNGEEGGVYVSITESDKVSVESDKFFEALDNFKEGDAMIYVPEIPFEMLSIEQLDWLIGVLESGENFELAS